MEWEVSYLCGGEDDDRCSLPRDTGGRIAVCSDGALVIVDRHRLLELKVACAGAGAGNYITSIRPLAGSATMDQLESSDGIGEVARFNLPTSVAVLEDGSTCIVVDGLDSGKPLLRMCTRLPLPANVCIVNTVRGERLVVDSPHTLAALPDGNCAVSEFLSGLIVSVQLSIVPDVRSSALLEPISSKASPRGSSSTLASTSPNHASPVAVVTGATRTLAGTSDPAMLPGAAGCFGGWGGSASADGGIGGFLLLPKPSASFSLPAGVSCDYMSGGTVVADSGNRRIRTVGADGSVRDLTSPYLICADVSSSTLWCRC
jgi:hypothetical protein